VDVERAGEAEMDAMWSCWEQGKPRWLWMRLIITRHGLSVCLWTRKDAVFLQLKALLEPLATRFSTDHWGVHTASGPEVHSRANETPKRSSGSI